MLWNLFDAAVVVALMAGLAGSIGYIVGTSGK